MKDIQNKRDRRRIPIHKVGIKGLRYPVCVMDRANKIQQTVAVINMYINLPHRLKGAHMSRFVELLNRHRGNISLTNIGSILREMAERFESNSAHLEVRFPFFAEKLAPVSRAGSAMDYECAFLAEFDRRRGMDLVLEVAVPVATLCPCSKAISERGAHNQRSVVRISIRSRKLVWIEELIQIAEQEASAGLYALLKRADEKFLTEQAYSRPRFAEDLARAVALRLKADERIRWFVVESENMESIHNHNAYAMVVSADLAACRQSAPARLLKRIKKG